MKRKLAVCMCSIFSILWAFGITNATTITTNTTFLGAGPAVEHSAVANSGSISSHVSHEDNVYGGAFGTGEATANADSNGTLNVSASAEQNGYDGLAIIAMASYTNTFINTSSDYLSYDFSFGISEYLSMAGNTYSTVSPFFKIEILLNDSAIWYSTTGLHFDNTNPWSLSVDNPDIDITIEDGSDYYQDMTPQNLDVQLSGSYNGILNLGTFAPGSSFELQYNILANPAGMDSGQATSSGSIWGQVNSSPVPEPATMLLFGLGILGLAGVSRRKTVTDYDNN